MADVNEREEEIVDVECSSGHPFRCTASKRVPEEERLTFCPVCFVCVVAPLCRDESKWVNW